MSNPDKKVRAVIPSATPTQFELASLAAILLQSCTGDTRRPERLVQAALDLWHEAGKQLETYSSSDWSLRARLKVLGRFTEPILVGKHLMPAIPTEFLLNDCCDLDEFLLVAIGMSEKADRISWFRAFLSGWEEPNLTTSPFYTSYPGGTKRYPTYLDKSRERVPSESRGLRLGGLPVDPSASLHKSKPTAHENLESFRVNGIEEPVAMAAAFRAWRLTMKNHRAKANEPYDLEICIALAKAKQKS